MATAMTDNGGHSSGTTTPSHLLPVPSGSQSNRGLLPFPTSPSLPDRRARLARLNVSMATASYDEADDDSDKEQWRMTSFNPSRENRRKLSDYNTGRGIRRRSGDRQMSWSKERERINKKRTAMDGEKREEEEEEEEDDLSLRLGGHNLPRVHSNDRSYLGPSSNVNTARSQRRNIITPRVYRDALPPSTDRRRRHEEGREEHRARKEAKEADTQQRLQGSDENAGQEEEKTRKFRLPSISLRKSSPPLHGDFFLTSIGDYEELAVRNSRRSSTTSKESSKDMSRGTPSSREDSEVTHPPPRDNKTPPPPRDNKTPPPPRDNKTPPPPRDNNPPTEPRPSSNDIPLLNTGEPDIKEKEHNVQNTELSSPPFTSRIPVPVPVTSRDSAPTSSRDTKGLQRVYLEGLDYMRGHVTNVEEELNKIDREFHKIHTKSADDRMYYLKECNERLLQANSQLRKHDVRLEVIDSATRLVRLLNGLRALKPPADKGLVDFLTQFWDISKSTTEQLKALLIKFDTTVLQRLSNNYITSHSADLKVPVCQQYALDIEDFLRDLGQQLSDADLLVKTYESGIHQDLLDSTGVSGQLMLFCDLKAFPILGFVQAVCVKISLMCQKARQWLARDEQFMHEINTFIRETRSVARRREMVLQNEKEKHKRKEKNVRIAQSMLHNNRGKLGMIEKELKELEEKLSDSKVEQKQKTEQIHQKETMVDFLKLTLQQTKRNYTLQSKRSKLLRQVQALEEYMRTMEHELETVQDRILAKSHEKILLKEKVHTSEQSYDALKTGLDKFSDNLEKLEADVSSLSGQLLQLEIVHTIRTSPETLDNLIDRPSTVKLSQSLKERIRERKRKAAMKDS